MIVAPTPTTAVNGARLTGPGPAGFPAPLGAMQDSDASTDPARDGVDGVVVHLLVKAEQVRPGGTIRGHLQVINNTGHALRGGSVCRASVIGPVIFGGQFPERPVFVKGSCSQPFAFPVGTTTLPFALPVSYRSATGSHPLPTGYYHVAVVVRGPRIPVPAPLTVIVLDA